MYVLRNFRTKRSRKFRGCQERKIPDTFFRKADGRKQCRLTISPTSSLVLQEINVRLLIRKISMIPKLVVFIRYLYKEFARFILSRAKAGAKTVFSASAASFGGKRRRQASARHWKYKILSFQYCKYFGILCHVVFQSETHLYSHSSFLV